MRISSDCFMGTPPFYVRDFLISLNRIITYFGKKTTRILRKLISANSWKKEFIWPSSCVRIIVTIVAIFSKQRRRRSL